MKRALKAIYAAIPFKKQLFSLLKPFHPSEKLYRHLYFTGAFSVDAGGGKFRINHWGFQNENELFWRGISGIEGASLNLWKELAKTSNTIIHIGANTGVYSLVAGAVNRQARIISF